MATMRQETVLHKVAKRRRICCRTHSNSDPISNVEFNPHLEETMQYRLDPKTGRQISQLGFGCMRFPNKAPGIIDEKASERLILHALENGVNYFDTAYLYPGSEDVLGRIISRNGIREHMLLATKLPQYSCKKNQDFNRFFEISIGRLRTDYIDYYLMHNITSFAQWENLLALGIEDWIAEKKESGAIRSLGFSFHGSLDEFKKLIDAYDWDFVQIQYNYANEHYQAGVEGLHIAAERGIPVFIMEPLLGGKLADSLPERAQMLFAEKLGGQPVAASVRGALRWIWNQSEVTMLLSGMNSMQQLEENLKTANEAHPGMLAEEDRALYEQVLAIFQESYRIPCTGCNYCMPCPKGINIPAMFSCYNNSYSTSWFHGVFTYIMSCGAVGNDPHYATDCIKCGKCAKHCPQKIDIPTQMSAVSKRLQPPLTKLALKLYTNMR